MRLLHTERLTFNEWYGVSPEPYAILSHTWSHVPGQEEVTYQQVLSKEDLSEIWGWQKVLQCCEIARSRGFEWAWIDTCCIDKTNSTELSETINSMFAYYQKSAECYAFLDDVPNTAGQGGEQPPYNQAESELLGLDRSRWFTRGWTLQELLAPSVMLFYNHSREFIGTRSELAPRLSAITGICSPYLTRQFNISKASVAQRMSWASRRETIRPEDAAYSLLGIFQVHMPLLYGEGQNAFKRLQLKILKRWGDESLFAWGIHDPLNFNPGSPGQGILANAPKDFAGCGAIERIRSPEFDSGPRIESSMRGISFRHRARWLAEWKRVTLACQIVGEGSSVRRIDLHFITSGERALRTGISTTTHSLTRDFFSSLVEYEQTVLICKDSANFYYAPEPYAENILSIFEPSFSEGTAPFVLGMKALIRVALSLALSYAVVEVLRQPLHIAISSVAILLALFLVNNIRMTLFMPQVILLGALVIIVAKHQQQYINDGSP